MPAPSIHIAVDRIEGERAILDFGGELIEIPAAALPDGIGEGSRVQLSIAEPTSEADDEAQMRLQRLRARSTSLDEIDF
jgi:hypothetical protein